MTYHINSVLLAPRAITKKGPLEIDFGPHKGKAIANWAKLNALMPFISQVLGQENNWRAVSALRELRLSSGYKICPPRWCMQLSYEQWQALSSGLRHLGTSRLISNYDPNMANQAHELGKRARTEYNRLSRYRRAL